MLRASHQHPRLVAQVVPSPVAFTFEPAVQRALDSGCLGDIFYVEVTLLELRQCWLHRRRAAGGGCQHRVRSLLVQAACQQPLQLGACCRADLLVPGAASVQRCITTCSLPGRPPARPVQVKAVANTFAEAAGAALHWRHDVRRSGLNVGAFGIMFEPLQRCASVSPAAQT